VSRERARRREEREREAAARREARERREQRLARRRTARRAWRARLPHRTRWRRQQGLLARRRRAQNAAILGLFLAVQAVVWLVTSDPSVRLAAALFGVLSLPVLVTLTLDRRSHP
jgi:Flp pilus assembly protein TadB